MGKGSARIAPLSNSVDNGKRGLMKLNLNNHQMRQQLLNFNQLFQDSLMVINSTRMKLNDPKRKDKKSSLPNDLATGISHLQNDGGIKFIKK